MFRGPGNDGNSSHLRRVRKTTQDMAGYVFGHLDGFRPKGLEPQARADSKDPRGGSVRERSKSLRVSDGCEVHAEKVALGR